MDESVHEVAMYTKIRIRCNVLISAKIMKSGNPLVPEVPDITNLLCMVRTVASSWGSHYRKWRK
jgi:hypothetical protein